jgi:hypothetical protein
MSENSYKADIMKSKDPLQLSDKKAAEDELCDILFNLTLYHNLKLFPILSKFTVFYKLTLINFNLLCTVLRIFISIY